MNFDADRLAALAGLGVQRTEQLNEASNRSQHDEKYYQDEVPHRFGKGQLSEKKHSDEDVDEVAGMAGTGEQLPMDEEYGDMEEMGHAEMEEMQIPGSPKPTSEMHHGSMEGVGHAEMEELDDVVLEIDENMLRNEIKRMRQERINENNLRMAIRNEIQDIFGDLGLNEDASWIYGDNKPNRSKDGQTTRGFLGIGFKK